MLKTLSSDKAILSILRTATKEVQEKQRSVRAKNIRLIHKALAVRQFTKAEKELTEALIPFFVEQGRSMVDRLKKLEVSSTKTVAPSLDSAHALASLIFDPKEWREKLTNRLLPVMAQKMAEAGVAHLMALGIDVRKKDRKGLKHLPGRHDQSSHGRGGGGDRAPRDLSWNDVELVPHSKWRETKATTASEWVDEHMESWESLLAAYEASGLPLGLLNEIPRWMLESIAEQLIESFDQDYWDAVSQTTMGDAEKVLSKGLSEGWSIHRMGMELRQYFEGGGFRYARRRAENIAMTESANALNGARKESVVQLQQELGPRVPIKQVWLSVLSNTTRASHAMLDQVPEDENGLWNLSGYMIPWPGHISLPPGERCWCYCTVSIEFGMNATEAQSIIDEYWQRVQEWESKGYVWLWVKHLPGRHDQSSHGRGGGRRARALRTHKPSTVEKQRRAKTEQARLAKLIGGMNTDNNDAFDVLLQGHAIEVKCVMDNNNDKITMHPKSRRRKESYARKNGMQPHTVAIDIRRGQRAFYYRKGIGSFRLRNMKKVTITELEAIVAGKSVVPSGVVY